MYERYHQPLLPIKAFYRRMLRSLAFSLYLLGGTVLIGMLAFHFIEKFPWLDSFLNCTLIMTGVGTVRNVSSPAGKIFTGVYSVASTLVFFTVLAIIFTPLLHRLLHKFHLDVEKRG
jgi:sterol desaturase/sphingolipid hydroxylase (fatty acid hydroxylase superfamily)